MKKKVLLIGLDGARSDAVLKANTPNIDKLMKNGAFNMNAQTEIRSISGPAWTALLTGVHTEKHNVFDNEFEERNFQYESLSLMLKKWKSQIKCVAHSNWKPIITKIFENDTLDRKSSGSDKKMTKNLIKDIIKDNGDFYFIQMDEIDGAGHKYTYGPEIPKYIECIEGRDAMIGQILEAVNQRPKDEDWLICVVSDHGGTGHGHGKPVMGDLTIVFIVSGDSVKTKGEILLEDEDEMVEIVDMVPTIASFLGIPPKDYWDGKIRGFGN